MKAELSNRSAGQRLPRSLILRGKDSFGGIFRQGSRISGTYADLRYVAYHDPARGRKVAFIAGRKLGNAVKRNRGKRLLREAFRLQQHFLDPVSESADIGLHVAFILKSPHADYQQLSNEVGILLQRLVKNVNATSDKS